jgi:HAMP domain-containing protein/HPt (histidine-containing phosphotransfer) domain-containing protein
MTMKYKIWLSFGLLVALLIAVGFITQTSMKDNENQLVRLVNDVQPAVVLSMRLIDQLDRASASLGFYLLSKEEIHKQDYIQYLQKINESVEKLQSMPAVQRDSATLALVQNAKVNIKKLESYKQTMLELAENNAKNLPALSYAGEVTNPRAQIMLQALQEMLISEQDQEATPERKQLLIDINNIRYRLITIMNELRAYLAFRQGAQARNFKTMRGVMIKYVNKLNAYNEDLFTFEQLDALETFNENYEDYFDSADKLLKMHQAEDWRQDAYIIRKEISPLLVKVQNALNKNIDNQNKAAVENSKALTDQVYRTQIIVISLIGIGMLSALLVGYFLSQAITSPISRLKETASQLAQGNLDHPIDTSRTDELGSLAQSFAGMRDSIRQKIDDLRQLNMTSEELAGIRDQMKVLQTALRVMKNQTGMEWGSVYSFNAESGLFELKAYYPRNDDILKRGAKSFAPGEGIVGRAAEEKRVIFVSDTSKEENFIATDTSADQPRAIVCVPLVDDDGNVSSIMNFNGEVEKARFGTEDAEFAETIARMTVITAKNIDMLNVIEEQNRTLEHKVQERTAELHQKTNDINNMLQNMHQGIFTIESNNVVHSEYSAYLEHILETPHIKGENPMDLLFKDSKLGSNTLDQIQAALGSVLGEDAMMFDFNKHLLVKEYKKSIHNGSTKTLELDWDPIINDENLVEKLMVTVRDVTELRVLQEEAEKQKWELEIIGQILSISKNKFEGFINDAYDFIEENKKTILQTDNPDPVAIATLFRNMHTIKGNARTYGLKYITDAVHDAESTYDRLRKGLDTEWDRGTLLEELDRARELIETYERIFRTKLAGKSEDGIYVDSELLSKTKEVLAGATANDQQSLEDSVTQIKNLINAIDTETIPSMLDGVLKSVPDLSAQLGIETPEIVVKDNGIRLMSEITPVLKNIFTHSFRNSIDHGLEKPDERKAAGKSDRGKITLEATQKGDKLQFRLHDDGRGLALAKLRQCAIDRGLIKPGDPINDKTIAELIFLSGISTADNVSDISGRGIGMEAVKRFLEKLGGSIEIEFTGEETAGYRPFESRITIPADVGVKVA